MQWRRRHVARQLLQILGLAAAAGAGEFRLPPPGRTLLLVGQDTLNIDSYVETVSRPGGFSVYVNPINLSAGLDRPFDAGAGENYADRLLNSFGRQVVLNIAVWYVGLEHAIANGTYDAGIDAMAAWVNASGVPVLMRPGYEADAPWNHFEPEVYVSGFRRFVDRFRAAEVHNVLWVWHSAVAQTYGHRERTAWYPGDDYVDLFGLSVFSQIYAEGNPHKPPASESTHGTRQDILQFASLARLHLKPLMVCESTPFGYILSKDGDSAWEAFFAPVFALVEELDVRVFAYINDNWDAQAMWQGQGWGDSRVQSSESIKASWLQEITKPRWVTKPPGIVV